MLKLVHITRLLIKHALNDVMKKINPNSFVTIEAEWLDKDSTNKWLKSIQTRPWKDIHAMETLHAINGDINYWVFLEQHSDSSKTSQFKITKELYNSLVEDIKQVDWDIPIVENIEMVREMVKEEVGRTKVVKSAIGQLDVCTE